MRLGRVDEAIDEYRAAARLQPDLVDARYSRVRHEGRMWEVDVFAGDNAGLIVAEVELPSADAPLSLPEWVGAEVSHDPRFFNSNLARHPYRSWLDR